MTAGADPFEQPPNSGGVVPIDPQRAEPAAKAPPVTLGVVVALGTLLLVGVYFVWSELRDLRSEFDQFKVDTTKGVATVSAQMNLLLARPGAAPAPPPSPRDP